LIDEHTLSQNAADNCFVCGEKNDKGLKLKFKISKEICTCEFIPLNHHVGYKNVIHGGLIFAVLDDCMANWFYLKGIVAFTARAETRFYSKLRVGETAIVTAKLENKKRNLVSLESKMHKKNDSTLIASSNAKFMVTENAGKAL